jgi:FkbM family methyltransferase
MRRAGTRWLKRTRWRLQAASLRPRDFEQQIYVAAVREGDLVFDVGANVGTVAGFVSRLVGPSGRVVAFEPLWPAYDRLCDAVRGGTGGVVLPVPLGAAAVDGKAPLQVPRGLLSRASLAPGPRWGEVQGTRDVASYTASFVSLDTFCSDRGISSVQFLKIDVEGAELLVLRGARALLERCRPILFMEVFAPWQAAFGYAPRDVVSLLPPLGYRIFFACPGGLVEHVPSAEEPVPSEFRDGYNVLAVCPDRHGGRLAALDGLRRGSGRTILPMAPAPGPNLVPRGGE